MNKATGLSAALEELDLSPHNVVGVGDAENDHAFLSLCEFSAAVANALPMLKERADFVTERSHGAGRRRADRPGPRRRPRGALAVPVEALASCWATATMGRSEPSNAMV